MQLSEVDTETKFVVWEDAINWIAFGQFDTPSFDPQRLEAIKEYHPLELNEFTAGLDGRRYLAFDLLWVKVTEERIKVAGRLVSGEANTKRLDQSSTLESLILDGGEHPRWATAQKFGPDPEFIPVDVLKSALLTHGPFGMIFVEGRGYYEDLFVPYNEFLDQFPKKFRFRNYDYFMQDAEDGSNVVELSPRKVRMGRPRAYVWDEFYQEVIRIANTPDGLPEKMADLERQMSDWCSRTWGRERVPASSTIRGKVAPLYNVEKQRA